MTPATYRLRVGRAAAKSRVGCALALLLSGCVTTATIAPTDLIAVAGLPERAQVPTDHGTLELSGSQQVTVHTRDAAYELSLSVLRRVDEMALLLPPADAETNAGTRLSLDDLVDAQLQRPAPWRTVGLVSAIGVALVVGVAVVAAISVANAGHNDLKSVNCAQTNCPTTGGAL